MHAALLLAALAAGESSSQKAQAPRKKIVLLAGKKSHGPVGNGIHDYGWSARLLQAMLDNSNIHDRVRVEVHLDGWPRDPSTLDDADSILVISDGRDGSLYEEAPHLASPERVRLLDRQMKRGCGFLTFHFSTFAPNKYADEVLRWSGAYFQWETNGKRQWYSAITTKEAPVTLGSPDHPVCRGLTPFSMREEFYYNLRFRDGDTRTKPIWVVPSLGGRKDGGNVVAWAREREDGGRGFGTTCGHFYDNWRHDNFRKLILNALAWTAKVEVPENGVEARYFTHEEIEDPKKQGLLNVLLVAGNDAHKWHNWEKTTPRIKEALQKDDRVRVDVVTDFEELGKRDLSRYQVVLLNWCNWQDPRGAGDKSKQAFARFVRDGGGLVLVHFANGAFHPSLPKAGESDWPEYRKIVRRVWNHHRRGDRPPSGHDAFGKFTVLLTKAKSPLTEGMKRFEIEDELYFGQDGDEPVEPLLAAESKETKKLEPLAWTYHYGKGRVFQTLLGHSEKTWDAAEMRELLRRATAWAAGVPIRPSLSGEPKGRSHVLDKDRLLDGQTFWDNRDRDWFKNNVPFFECPDPDLMTTYYYRWELMTKHLTYGSPNTGYVFTEFIDRPFWSGRYGAISCPAGLQLYEARWLRDSSIAHDYLRYWFRTPGAEPRRYSTWLADAAVAVAQVHPQESGASALLPDLVRNYQGWERSHFDRDVGLFWQTGHDDGMEININSRQTADTVRGAPGYRPTLNAYLWADAVAIARLAEAGGEKGLAAEYRDKAARLKAALQKKLWDPKREFFFPMAKRDEMRDGHTVKALSLTYQTGKYAGSPYGRELIGYVPWQFNLPDPGYEAAWSPLMDRKGFFTDYGPTTVERNDPQFLISKTCCVWSGNSWPYATTQTLKAMANLLQNYKQGVVTKADYLKLLTVYAKTHRKNGKPYLAEACHPDTGSWEGHDAYNHSEHYFHSGYVDLILTGLVGLVPREDDTVEVHPLAPAGWDYFAVDDVPYHRRRLAVVWDRAGERYGLGRGLHLLVNGRVVATRETLGPLKAKLPFVITTPIPALRPVNFAVNNDGGYHPRVVPSFANASHPVGKLNDGNFWYHASPPNRWTFEGSPNATDSLVLELGRKHEVRSLRLYFLDDGTTVAPPAAFTAEYHNGKAWRPLPETERSPARPAGRRANAVHFTPVTTDRLRVVFTHAAGSRTGLTEIEAWGDAVPPVQSPPFPTGNLAYNDGKQPFPRVSASHTSRHDKAKQANDGVISYAPTPHNRWTAYESPNPTDWLEIDFGAAKSVGRVELAIYDDRGGVQAPASYAVQHWDGKEWRDVASAKKTPATPVGGQINEVSFDKVETSKVRLVFTHKGKACSGVSEVLVWPPRAP